jgi:hypothetical protein
MYTVVKSNLMVFVCLEVQCMCCPAHMKMIVHFVPDICSDVCLVSAVTLHSNFLKLVRVKGSGRAYTSPCTKPPREEYWGVPYLEILETRKRNPSAKPSFRWLPSPHSGLWWRTVLLNNNIWFAGAFSTTTTCQSI